MFLEAVHNVLTTYHAMSGIAIGVGLIVVLIFVLRNGDDYDDWQDWLNS